MIQISGCAQKQTTEVVENLKKESSSKPRVLENISKQPIKYPLKSKKESEKLSKVSKDQKNNSRVTRVFNADDTPLSDQEFSNRFVSPSEVSRDGNMVKDINKAETNYSKLKSELEPYKEKNQMNLEPIFEISKSKVQVGLMLPLTGLIQKLEMLC